MNNKDISEIRNVAIIAHVDHGKTTLVDAFLKQSTLFRANEEEMKQTQILDSNELEREKGITILAKNIAIPYKDFKINIIDTPGHADFGGEVERTLNMADGAILVVDAQEGPMPQTEFVLKKALEFHLKIIVVVNKIDKKYANIQMTKQRLDDLFLKLAVDDVQLDFPVFYAVGRAGKVWEEIPKSERSLAEDGVVEGISGNVQPLLEAIVKYVPAPSGDKDGPFQMQITSLDFDPHIGRYLIGRVNRGIARVGQKMLVVFPPETLEKQGAKGLANRESVSENSADEKEKVSELPEMEKPTSAKFPFEKVTQGSISQILVKNGLKYEETKEGTTGDIIAVAGLNTTEIGATICAYETPEPLPNLKISPPSVKIKIEPNNSPFAGRDGDFVTAKQLEQRMYREKEMNIGLRIVATDGGGFYVSGRGELQLSILLETMRREGYEFQVRRPEVILIEEEGKKKEPLEELSIVVAEEYLGIVTSLLGQRNAKMENMETRDGNVFFSYSILTRNLLGLRNELMNSTRGTALVNSYVREYVPFKGAFESRRNGVLVAFENGMAIGYALNMIQERGDLFIPAGTDVYEGMIIGINKYDQDIDVNACKERHKSSVRMKHDEITQTALKVPVRLTLEYALVFITEDEMLEVTPKNLRLRKILLKQVDRVKLRRKTKKGVA